MGAVAAFLTLRNTPQAAAGRPVAVVYLTDILLSITVGIVVALVIPLGKLGRTLAMKTNANPPSPRFVLINSIPMSVGNTVIISFVVSLIGVILGRMNMPPAVQAATPFIPMWLGNWIRLLIPTLIISYILSVLLTPVISRALGLGRSPKGKGAR